MKSLRVKRLSKYIQQHMPKLLHEGNVTYIYFDFMKRIPAAYMIQCAIEQGKIDENTVIIDTTSGTFGIGLAEVCGLVGLECHIISDPAIYGLSKIMSELQGATIHIVKSPDETGNYQRLRLELVSTIKDMYPNHYVPSQYSNPNNSMSYSFVASHILKHINGIPDYIVTPVGSGGLSSGLYYSFSQLGIDRPKFVAVDTPGSVLFGDTDRPRRLRGLGNSIFPKNFNQHIYDRVYWASLAVAVSGAQDLYQHTSLFQGLTSGAAHVAGQHLNSTKPNANVAIVLPDVGSRYLDILSDSVLKQPCDPIELNSIYDLQTLDPDGWAFLDYKKKSKNVDDNLNGKQHLETSV